MSSKRCRATSRLAHGIRRNICVAIGDLNLAQRNSQCLCGDDRHGALGAGADVGNADQEMRRAVRVDANSCRPQARPEWITAQGHADAMLPDATHHSRLMPFFVPADALRPLDDALLEVVRCERSLAFVF